MAKVLLVEDDNNLREIFEMRLQAEGYSTLVASDGEEALVVAMKEKPDLIVADVMMPKLSGFEMLETLRAAPEMANVKVIMMTALGQAEDQARGEKLGVVKYLVKSQVTLEDFARVVREVLQPGATAKGSDSQPKAGSPSEETSSNNNKGKQESEKSMPEDSQPTNPMPGDTSAPASNPISDAPSADSGSGDPVSSAQAQSGVQDQINDFVGSGAPSAPPAGDPSTPPAGDSGTTEHSDVPVVDAPASSDPAAPAGDDSSAPGAPSGDASSNAL